MSNRWGYHCKKCKADSETWFNHGEKQLKELYKLAPNLSFILGKFKVLDVSVDFSGICTINESPLEWLTKHNGHDICLKNEYGNIKSI